MAPVAVTELNCDGDSYKCTGNLVREPHSPAFSWLKSEILGLGRWELGRPVERLGVPPSSVQQEEGYRELSTLNKMATPWRETPLERYGPGSCQWVKLRWQYLPLHCKFGEHWQSPWWLISSTDVDIACRAGLWWWGLGGTVGNCRLPPERMSPSRMSSPISQVHSVVSSWCDAVQIAWEICQMYV